MGIAIAVCDRRTEASRDMEPTEAMRRPYEVYSRWASREAHARAREIVHAKSAGWRGIVWLDRAGGRAAASCQSVEIGRWLVSGFSRPCLEEENL